MSSVAGGCGNPTWEYPELDQLYLNFKASVQKDDILKWEQAIGDYLYTTTCSSPWPSFSPYHPMIRES